MTVNLLTNNQERRLLTHLRLLLDDLDALATLPELERAGEAGRRVLGLLDETRAAARELRAALGLPENQGTTPARRVAATAEVWAVRVEDLRARRLRGYGEVHPDLGATLDPRLDHLRRALLALAEAATGLPEP
jgi:hypothetical protein